MWIWWTVSLIVLIACFIFAYKAIVSSFDFLPADKRSLFFFKRDIPIENTSGKRSDAFWDLKNQLQKVEENTSFYELQISKLQERLMALETQLEDKPISNPVRTEDDEDWKEMYYQENAVKEKLENQLDMAVQKLEEAEEKLKEVEENMLQFNTLKSNYDAQLNGLHSMQNKMGDLQRELEAANNREKELQLSLFAEIQNKKHYEQLDISIASLKSENEILKKQLADLHSKEKEMYDSLNRLKELESQVVLYEDEKAKMIASLELMVRQTKIFSASKNT